MLHDLEFFLKHKESITQHGWSIRAFDFPDFHLYFPDGLQQAAEIYFQKTLKKTFQALNEENIENLGIFAKVKLALMTRFKTLESYKPIEESLFNYIKLSPQGMRFLYKIIDETWYWAGDQSTDHNFYTKRTLLAGIYISAFKTWLKDNSEDLNLTSYKIDSHFERIKKIPQIKNDIKTFFNKFKFFILFFVLHSCSQQDSGVFWEKTDLHQLPGIHQESLEELRKPLQASCRVMKPQKFTGHNNQKVSLSLEDWKDFCSDLHTDKDINSIFQDHLHAYKIKDENSDSGKFTGYYEPLLFGSLKRHGPYQTPLYKLPPIKKRYFTREQILSGKLNKQNLELLWVKSPIDAFFLAIQGSGRVQLENGSFVRVGYSGQNGHPYFPIGKVLIEKYQFPKEKLNMHTLKAWLKSHPKEAEKIMNQNPSYVFFKELDLQHHEGPIGALSVPLTPNRSLAVDTRYIPLGAPLWVDMDHPSASTKIRKGMVAQDKGGAIKGVIRGDYFWGFGASAEQNAGAMKSTGQYYLLLPKTASP